MQKTASSDFNKQELENILTEKIFQPEKLIFLLAKKFPGIFQKGTDVWEGYNLEQHTLMAMKQFEKYFADKKFPAEVSNATFRLILGLHDIGKPQAIENGGKHLQHHYTQKIIRELFKQIDIDKKTTKLTLVLTSGDPLGNFLRNKKDIVQTKKEIEKMAKEAALPVADFFEILIIFFKSDASSYTENAGGLKALDHLFIFDEKKRELKFAPEVQEKIDQLKFN